MYTISVSSSVKSNNNFLWFTHTGQFQQTQIHLFEDSIREDDVTYDKTAIVRVNDNHTVKVKHASREVLLTGTMEMCWFASNNGQGLVEGRITDYLEDAQFGA